MILCLLTLIPFGFFFYRDVASKWDSAQGVDSCTPYDVSNESIGKDYIKFTWKTKEECISYLRLSKTPSEVGELVVGDTGLSPSRQHSSEVKNLRPNSTYYVLFYAGENEYGLEGQPLSVTTRNF